MVHYIEIGFVPLVKSAFPDETHFVDTRFSWNDRRGREKATGSRLQRLKNSIRSIAEAFTITPKSGVKLIVVRARGAENTKRIGLTWLLKKGFGFLLHSIALQLVKRYDCKLAVIDRRDEASIHPNDRRILEQCDFYFIREMPWSSWSVFDCLKPNRECIGEISHQEWYRQMEKKIAPLSLGIPDEDVLPAKQYDRSRFEYDVFYVGNSHGTQRRIQVEEVLNALSSEGYKVSRPRGVLSESEFWTAIESAKLAISPGGVGWDCFRHYEIPSACTAMLLEHPCHQAYKAPEHGREAILYKPNGLTVDVIKKLLQDEDLLERVARQGHHWVKENHTYSALGRHVVLALRQK